MAGRQQRRAQTGCLTSWELGLQTPGPCPNPASRLTRGGEGRAEECGHGADLGGGQLLLHGRVLVRVAAAATRWAWHQNTMHQATHNTANAGQAWRPNAGATRSGHNPHQPRSCTGSLRCCDTIRPVIQALCLPTHTNKLAPHRIMSSMKPMALAAREPRGPAEMVFTRTPYL